MRLRWLIVAMVLSACITRPGPGQIVNGGFHDGGDGWTVQMPDGWESAFALVGGNPGRWADFRSPTSGPAGTGCIEQVFHCGPAGSGPTCLLSFDYFCHILDAGPDTGRLRVELDDELVLEIGGDNEYGPPPPFRTASLAVPGGTHELRICLESDQGPSFWQLAVDNVSAESPCPADLTGDQAVTQDDLLEVLQGWGACPEPCPTYCSGDINGDCRVDVMDLVSIITEWGACAAGACCLDTGCVQLPWQDCVAADGVFQGGGVPCDETTCVSDPCAEIEVCFEAGGSTPVGFDPRDVILEDLDGDGDLDLATSDIDSGTVSVRMGDGDGTFGPIDTYFPGPSPRGLTAADLDGDDAPDLVVIHGGNSTISVLMSLGDGTFADPVQYPAAPLGRDVTIADMNGDGLLDVAAASSSFGSTPGVLAVYINEGGGVLGESIDTFIERGAGSVRAGDLDGDGDTDLAVAHSYSGFDDYVGIYFNVGDGHIEMIQEVPVPRAERALLGDLDDNGDLDMLVVGGSMGVAVVLQDDDGGFAVDGIYDTGVADPPHSHDMYGSSFADVDGDGDLDAVVSSHSLEVWVLLNDGAGVLAADSLHIVGGAPLAVATGDLDGDGKPDIAVARAWEHDVVILLNALSSAR